MKTALAVFAFLAGTASVASAQSIQGVWNAVEIDVDSGPQRGRHTDVQGALLIFTGHYYSLTAIPGFTPRPKLGDSPTYKELARVFGQFIAEAGTYTLRGDTVTNTNLVAKNPADMDGRPGSFAVRVVGDTLWVDYPTGPVVKFVRVE